MIQLPETTKMPALGLAVFDNSAGVGALGAGLDDLGQGMRAYVGKLRKANDAMQWTAAENIRRDLITEFELEATRTPEVEHLSLWNTKYAGRLNSEVGKLPFSPDSREEAQAWLAGTQNKLSNEIQLKANDMWVDRHRGQLLADIYRAGKEERFEDANALIERGRHSMLLRPGEAERMLAENDHRQSVSFWVNWSAEDPAKVIGVMSQAMETGKYPPHLGLETTMALRRRAEQINGQMVQDITNDLIAKIDQDPINITDKEIDEQLSNPRVKFPPDLASKLKEGRMVAYEETPIGKAEKDERYSRLHKKISDYMSDSEADFASTDKHLEKAGKIRREIVENVVPGQRVDFVNRLNDIISDARSGVRDSRKAITKSLIDRVNLLAANGRFGDAGGFKEVTSKADGKDKVKVPVDEVKYAAVQSKLREATDEMLRIMRENPNLSQAEAEQKAAAYLRTKIDMGVDAGIAPDAAPFSVPLFENFSPFNPAPPTKPPASVRNNNPGAQYPGAIAKRFGSTSSATIGGGHKIATFDNPVNGAAAQIALLQSKGYAGKTIRDAISKWSGGNSVASYLSVIKRETGVSGDDILTSEKLNDPEFMVSLAKAMAKHEAGMDFPLSDDQWRQAFNLATSTV